MANFQILFRNWFGHLVERCVRLNQYLSERSAGSPESHAGSPLIVQELLRSLDDLADEICAKSTFLLASSNSSVTDNRSTFYSSARAAAEKFRRLHSYISYIPSPWPSPELELFLRKVLEEGGYRTTPAKHWSILLSADYNFSHLLLPAHGITVGSALKLQNVLHVPAAEKDNPLIWPNLVHEVAHMIGVESGIVEAAQAMPRVQNKSGQARTILEEWSHEIVADLLAADFLGPAYLGAFVSYVAYWIPYSLRRRSLQHPEASARVNYIFRHLRGGPKEFQEALLTQLFAEYNGRLQLDHEDAQIRTQFFEDVAPSRAALEGYPSADELQEFADEIAGLPAYAHVAPLPLDEGDSAIIKRLADRIVTGQLIATRREPLTFRKFESEADVRNRFSEALDQLTDIPNRVSHILNAALLRKLGYGAPSKRLDPATVSDPMGYHVRLLQDFCELGGDARKRLTELRRTVTSLDLLISKSIEATEIVRFYRSGTEGSIK